jgi:hypothetical protein
MAATFEYRGLAERLGIPPQVLGELESLVHSQYGHDEMMVELRMLRTLRAIEAGSLTAADAIAEFRADLSHSVASIA